ncbi:cob(I)yrinic acid a,c-diamide adenosyltransferase [Kaarinaea lacus]
MGNRLSKIYTRTGDKGTTGLSDGSRVTKDNIRICTIGTVDELNSTIGLILSCPLDEPVKQLLTDVQHKLFNIGGELSLPGYALIDETNVTWLEDQLDALNANLAPLKDFILPGGTTAAAYCHLARSICRRAERELVSLKSGEDVSDPVLQYINRLSDFLFVLARHINKQENHPDVLWDASKKD